MVERKPNSQPPDQPVQITNLDGSPISAAQIERRRVIRGGLRIATVLTALGGTTFGAIEVSNLIAGKNAAERRVKELELKVRLLEQAARDKEAETILWLNKKKQFDYDTTLCQIKSGFKGTKWEGPLSYLDGINEKELLVSMLNGKYESRTRALVRMMEEAKKFTTEHYEEIVSRPARVYKGEKVGELYAGNREKFIDTYSAMVAYAASVGVEIDPAELSDQQKIDMQEDNVVFDTGINRDFGKLPDIVVPTGVVFINGKPIVENTKLSTDFFLDSLLSYVDIAQKYVKNGGLLIGNPCSS